MAAVADIPREPVDVRPAPQVEDVDTGRADGNNEQFDRECLGRRFPHECARVLADVDDMHFEAHCWRCQLRSMGAGEDEMKDHDQVTAFMLSRDERFADVNDNWDSIVLAALFS